MEQVQKMVPAVQWEQALEDMGVTKKLDTIIVMQPTYMKTVQNVLSKKDIETWKTVMRWQTLNSAAGALSTEIETANWDFYSKYLSGSVARYIPGECGSVLIWVRKDSSRCLVLQTVAQLIKKRCSGVKPSISPGRPFSL